MIIICHPYTPDHKNGSGGRPSQADLLGAIGGKPAGLKSSSAFEGTAEPL
jgi:hypothetical protein